MSTYVLSELFAHGLQLLYAAHHQGAAQASANLASSSNPELKRSLEAGTAESREQAKRLEKVFKTAGLEPAGVPDQAMQGIIDATNAQIAQTSNPTERDLIIVASGQKAAHFYLASYGALRHYAEALGNKKGATLLQKTLDETGELDKKLIKLSNTIVRQAKARTSAEPQSEFSLIANTVSAFVFVGLVGAAITVAQQRSEMAPVQ